MLRFDCQGQPQAVRNESLWRNTSASHLSWVEPKRFVDPELVNGTLFGIRVFIGIIKLRISR